MTVNHPGSAGREAHTVSDDEDNVFDFFVLGSLVCRKSRRHGDKGSQDKKE